MNEHRFVAVGSYPRGAVRLERVPEPIPFSSEERAAIERAWSTALAGAQTRGGVLFPGPLLGLRGAGRDDDGALRLRLGPTDYREFVGTNLVSPPPQRRSDALGVSAAVVTACGHLLLGRRGPTVHERPGEIDVFGGHIEPGGDPFDAILAEVDEELGVGRDDALEPRVIGLSVVRASRKPELCFEVRLTIDEAAVRAAARTARDRFETGEIVSLPATAAGIGAFVGERGHELAPAGRATVEALAIVLASEADADVGHAAGDPS